MAEKSWREGLNQEKFVATVLYLLRGCSNPPGITALIKLIWYADYWHYQRHLTTITGARYIALENGPVLHDYTELLASLEPGFVETTLIPIQGKEHPKQEFVPRVQPDESLLSESETIVLGEVTQRLGHLSGSELIKRTHLDPPWLLTWDADKPAQHIPYMLFRWAENLPTEDDLEAARRLLAARPKLVQETMALHENLPSNT